MIKKLIIGSCMALCAAACATNPSTPAAPKVATTDTAPPGCVAETATRLPMSPRDCAAFGRQWSSNDIRSTGQTDIGTALRNLDPSVSASTPP